MARNGSGTYSLVAGNPVVTGTTVSSTTHNSTMADIANALTTSIAADGQTTPTANLKMGGYKLTGLGAATGAGDAVRYEQVAALADLAGTTHAATSKVTPVDADEFPIADSAATFGLKKLTWVNIKATLKTYFDALYTSLATVISTANSWTAAQRGAIVTLTYGATVTPDFSLANNFSLALTGNATLANPTNLVAGQAGSIFIGQDATGSRLLAYGTYFKFTGGTVPALTTTASANDTLDYVVRSATFIECNLRKDVK